jgi:hypothetical protein
LQRVEQLAGAPSVDAVIDQGSEDLGKRDLHVGEGSREGSTGPQGIVAAKNAFDVLLALVIAVVVEAEFFTAKSWGTAENAIFFEMVASRVRHKTSKCSVVSCQLSVKDNGQQSRTASLRELCPHAMSVAEGAREMQEICEKSCGKFPIRES